MEFSNVINSNIMTRIERQVRAFERALKWCRIYGFNWKTHIQPKIQKRQIVGYYILDEEFSTTVATEKI